MAEVGEGEPGDGGQQCQESRRGEPSEARRSGGAQPCGRGAHQPLGRVANAWGAQVPKCLRAWS